MLEFIVGIESETAGTEKYDETPKSVEVVAMPIFTNMYQSGDGVGMPVLPCRRPSGMPCSGGSPGFGSASSCSGGDDV